MDELVVVNCAYCNMPTEYSGQSTICEMCYYAVLKEDTPRRYLGNWLWKAVVGDMTAYVYAPNDKSKTRVGWKARRNSV